MIEEMNLEEHLYICCIFCGWHERIRCSSSYVASRTRYATAHKHVMLKTVTGIWRYFVSNFSYLQTQKLKAITIKPFYMTTLLICIAFFWIADFRMSFHFIIRVFHFYESGCDCRFCINGIIFSEFATYYI